jgi:hypothetical protein
LWISRATSSLPVPDSPWISTVASVGATRSICSRVFPGRGRQPLTLLNPV